MSWLWHPTDSILWISPCGIGDNNKESELVDTIQTHLGGTP